MIDKLEGKCRPKVKICGLTRAQDIIYVNSSCPDYIGFVFAKKSRRFVPYDEAALLRQQLKPSIQAVGVFVDEDPQIIAKLLNAQIIDAAQLHGSEDEAYIKELRTLTNKPVIQAIRVCGRADLIKADISTADFLLFDAPKAGSGTLFDWSLLENFRRPYFLAGGLNCQNVKKAIETLNPYGVDVSSGVETDGYKDQEKIEEFIKTCSC